MTEPPPEPKVGVWRAVARLGQYRFVDVVWPEGLPALVVGIGGTVLLLRTSHLPARIALVSDLPALAAVLLAVVFAALALVVSIPSARYIRELAKTEGGIQTFLDPFLVAVGTQIAVILSALTYVLLAAHVSRPVEHAAFYAIGFLFVFGLLDIVGLARSLVRHGINRSIMAASEESPDETGGADVHPLHRERGSPG